MRLLFDANLSPRLVKLLDDDFPDASHVGAIGSIQHDDRAIWDHASVNGMTIVSKDSDFHHMSFLFGAPPKVVWLRVGNASTQAIVDVLRVHRPSIEAFSSEAHTALLIVSGPSL